MNPDGSNRTQLTFESDRGPNLPSYMYVYDSGPKWSPDGTRIAFSSDRDYDSAEPYTIYIMDYPSRNVQRLILNQLTDLCAGVGHFEWSPDGSKFVLVVVSNSCHGPSSTNIYTVNTDGSGLVRLTNDVGVADYYPTWSPDGSQIAFLSGDPVQGYTTIQVMNADGSNRRQILSSYSWTAHWSPDGSKILFAYAGQLYTVKPDGTDLRQLTHPPTYYSYARWSPDGKKIAVVRDVNYVAGGVSDGIFVMDADGNGEQNISNFDVITPYRSTDDSSVDWQPLLAPANDPPPSVLGLSDGIYLASFGNGVERLESDSTKVIWPADNSDSHQRNVVSLYAEGNDKLWIGTAEAGVFSFDGNRVIAEPGLAELRNGSVWSITGNSKDGLWLATSRGLFRYWDGKLQQIL